MTVPISGKVLDDPDLLAVILEDWRAGGTQKELTGSLVKFYDSFATLLTERSLQENIKHAIRGITGVNGCDLSPIQRTMATLQNSQLLREAQESIFETLAFAEQNPKMKILPYELSLDDLNKTAFRICEMYGELHNAPSIKTIEMSVSHYPDYLFMIDDKYYSYVFLYSYIHYVYSSRFVDYAHIDNVIEIGPGAGRQVEIIKKFHPHLKFYLIDLGPTLYLCHQYLSSVFPDDIIPYTSTRGRDTISIEDPGKLAFIGNACIDNIVPVGDTISVSSAVFGLMPPTVAKRYLDRLSTVSNYIFMMESRGDESKGTYSLDASTCLEDFHRFLDEKFDLINHEPAFYPLSLREGFGGFEMMMWVRAL